MPGKNLRTVGGRSLVARAVGAARAAASVDRVVVSTDDDAPREEQWLRLNTDRAHHYLDWKPIWRYSDAIRETVAWYKAHHEGDDVAGLTRGQIERYMANWGQTS